MVAFLIFPLFAHLGQQSSEFVYDGLDGRGSLERGHVDILFRSDQPLAAAFVGLSSMWVGVDARSLESELQQAGLTSGVVVLGANHPGEDLVYSMAYQLLKKRKVALLVLSTPGRGQLEPHPMLHRIYQFEHHLPVLRDLELSDLAASYGLAVLGSPGQMLNRIRRPVGMQDRRGLTRHNGSWIRRLGWGGESFVEATDHDCCTTMGLYRTSDYEQLEFADVTTAYQRAYLEHTIRLARENNTSVAIFSPPLWRDRRTEKPVIRLPRSLLEAHDIPLIAQSGRKLFGELTDSEIQAYFYNANHLNPNGTKRVTDALIPVIRDLLPSNSTRTEST